MQNVSLPMSDKPQDTQIKTVHSLELFFDLVFVFAISQVTKLISHPQHWMDYVQAVLIFWSVFWVYSIYVWLTSNIELNNHELERWNLVLGMGCFFGMAVGISYLLHDDGMLFSLSFICALIVHFFGFRRLPNSSHYAIIKIAPYNFATGMFILLAVGVPSPWRWLIWGVAMLLHSLPRWFNQLQTFPFSFSPSHFIERHGLVIIIALGEGVMDLGIGASQQAISLSLIGYCLVGLLLLTSFWWAYFGLNQHSAEHEIISASPTRRIVLANDFSGVHALLLIGCILVAGSLEVGVLHPLEPSHLATAVNLAGGTILFLLGLQWMRTTLQIPPHKHLWYGTVLCLISILLGLDLNGLAQLVALVITMLFIGFSKVPKKQDSLN